MRMIGIGLMAFITAWAVFLLSSHNVAKRGIQKLNELAYGPQLRFEVSNPTPKITDLEQKAEVFFGTTSQRPIILSGIPAYQGAVFSMPIDARPLSGYLQIDMTSQVLSGVKGVLRVSIGNTKRGEILLYPGEAGRSLRIPLHPEELVKERLVVSFSMLGSHPSQTCSSQDGIAAVVEIETTSGLFLELDRVMTSPRDRVSAMGGRIAIRWNDKKPLQNQLDIIEHAAGFIKQGEKVVFHDYAQAGALGMTDLRTLKATFGPSVEPQKTFPHPIAIKGANFGSRSFHETTSWRIKYRPREFANQELPSSLDLKLTMSTLFNNALWTVTVTLNGTIVHNELLKHNSSSFHKNIALPAELQTVSNAIEVSLHSSHDNLGECNDGPILVAQMDRSTVLVGGDQQLDDQLYELQNVLGSVSKVAVIETSKLNHNQALFFSRMISLILPSSTRLVRQDGQAKVKLLSRDKFHKIQQVLPAGFTHWILNVNDSGDTVVQRIVRSVPFEYPSINSPNALLVSVPVTEDAS